MIVQQTKKRKFDQHINYYPTFDDPSNSLIIDNVTRHQENIHPTTHPHTNHIIPRQENTRNLYNHNNQAIEQYSSNPNPPSSDKNLTYTKRAPLKKIKNPYKG
jgi:hypothetical protein